MFGLKSNLQAPVPYIREPNVAIEDPLAIDNLTQSSGDQMTTFKIAAEISRNFATFRMLTLLVPKPEYG